MDALRHGLLPTYVHRRCRCTLCSAASREYCRARSRLKAYGRLPQLIAVQDVRTHIAWLAAHGIGWQQVAVLAGVGRTTVDRIAHPGGRRRGVTPRVADAVLHVLPGLDNVADGALIDATGSRRRLQALMLAGWSLTAVQRETGVSALGRILSANLVTARVARAVRHFYDHHWSSGPLARDATERAMIERVRARAIREGFLPALAWDDDTIDDQGVQADPSSVRPEETRTRVYLEDVQDLVRFGATWDEIYARTGACRNTVEVALARAGRHELIAQISSNRWRAA